MSANVFPPFPAEHHTRRIWAELAKASDEYHVIAMSGGPRFSHTRDGGVHLWLLPGIGKRGFQFFFTSWFALLLAMRYRPNRIIAQCPVLGGIAALVVGAIFGAPVLVEIHGAHYFRPSVDSFVGRLRFSILKAITGLSLRFSRRIRSLSSDMTGQLISTYGDGVREKVVEVGSRVDLEVFSPAKSNYRLDGTVRLISVGSFIPLKGHLELIEHVLPMSDSLSLTLVGRGPLQDEYVRLATRLGVVGRLRLVFAPTHSHVSSLLVASDIYVHPSHTEAVPRAVLEAMGVGLPVVATKVGFLGGVVSDGEDIILVEPRDPGSLVTALRRLIGSEYERERLGTNARLTVARDLEWNSAFARYRELVRNMVVNAP